MFKGGDCRKEFGVVPVFDDGSDEKLGDFDAGVANREFRIKEEFSRRDPRLRVRIRIEQARSKREFPPNGRSRDGCAVDVVENPEVFKCLSDPISQLEYRNVGGDVEIGIIAPDMEYFKFGVQWDTVFNPSEIFFPLGTLVYVPVSPSLADHQIVEKISEEILVKIWDTNTRGESVQTTSQNSNKFGLVEMVFFVVFQGFQSLTFFLELFPSSIK